MRIRFSMQPPCLLLRLSHSHLASGVQPTYHLLPSLLPAEHAAGGQPQWGTLVAPGVNAHIHQHFFQVGVRWEWDDWAAMQPR